MMHNIQKIKELTNKARLATLLSNTVMKTESDDYYAVGGYVVERVEFFKLLSYVLACKYIPYEYIEPTFDLNCYIDKNLFEPDENGVIVSFRSSTYKSSIMDDFRDCIQVSILNTFNFNNIETYEQLISSVAEKLEALQ